MIDSRTIERYRLPPTVFQAEGKLSVELGVPIDQAVRALEQWAELQGLSLAEAALAILRDSTWGRTSPRIDEEFLSVVRHH